MPIAKNRVGSRDPHEFQTELPDVINVNPKKATIPRKRTTQELRQDTDPRYMKRQGWYSDAKKMEVACTYAVTGNSRRTAEITKVKEGTIRAWKTTEWWNEIQSRIRIEQNEELDSKLTKLVDKAVDAVNDRLENGDFIYNIKQDKLVRKPINARDVQHIIVSSLDKRQLLRGEPTSISAKTSENEKLVRLAEQFKKFVQAKEIESEATAIEVENAAEEDQDGEEPLENWEEGGEFPEEIPTINEMFTE